MATNTLSQIRRMQSKRSMPISEQRNPQVAETFYFLPMYVSFP